MDKRKITINSFNGARKIRPKMIGVAAAVAILLILILAPSSALPIPQDIRFTGTVTAKNPPMPGSVWWNVTVEELIEGPQTSCDVLKVRLVIVPPMGHYESDIGIGDRVEVYGNYTSDCTVSLNGESYYIKKVRPQPPTLTSTGLIALVGLLLVGLLAAIAAVAIVRKRR